LSREITSYLKHGTNTVKVYPLAKFLIIIDILSNTQIDSSIRQKLRNEVINRIPDPLYIKEINSIKI
jgi:hypothetical protein